MSHLTTTNIKPEPDHHLVEVRLEFASAADRDEAAALMAGCPFALELEPRKPGQAPDAGHRPALRLLYCIPDEKLGWALAQADTPEVLGAVAGSATILRGRPDRRGELEPRLGPRDAPPCGSHCPKCPNYLTECGGCPVTPHYRPGYRFRVSRGAI